MGCTAPTGSITAGALQPILLLLESTYRRAVLVLFHCRICGLMSIVLRLKSILFLLCEGNTINEETAFGICEKSLLQTDTCHFSLQNGPFQLLKRSVLQPETDRLRTRNDMFCKSLIISYIYERSGMDDDLKYFYYFIVCKSPHRTVTHLCHNVLVERKGKPQICSQSGLGPMPKLIFFLTR